MREWASPQTIRPLVLSPKNEQMQTVCMRAVGDGGNTHGFPFCPRGPGAIRGFSFC